MKITDSYDNIFTVFDSGNFNKEKWRTYAESTHTGLREKIEEDYHQRISTSAKNNDKISSVINDVWIKRNLAETTHLSFLQAVKNLSENIKNHFNTELDVTIILYLGLCNAAGWATEINGKKVILIGIEKVIELNWCSESDMIGLIYHELGHIYHSLFEKKKLIYTQRGKSVRQLYREGIAMIFEQTLCGDDYFYHQNKNGWLKWCQDNEKRIKKEFLKRIENKKSVQDFFGDWCSFMGHSDIGYYLGTRFIRYLMKTHTFEETAQMKISEIVKQFYNFADE